MQRPSAETIKLALIDALLGVLIGSVSMATSTLHYRHVRQLDDYAQLTAFSMFFFGAAFFLATLLLAPFLIRWLRRRLDRPTRDYYRSAILGGLVFGLAASAAVGLFFPLTMALVPNVPNYTFRDRVLLTLLGPILFVPSALIIALIGFAIHLVVFGVGFGMFNGWMVKRTWPDG